MLTVSAACLRIDNAINNATPKTVTVKGEVTDHAAQEGTTYFALTDQYSKIQCYWNNPETAIDDGDTVKATGSLTTYAQRSQYQLTVQNITHRGEGRFKKRYKRIKRRLHDENKLSSEQKALPDHPSHITVVTSRESAAIHDVLSTLNQRYPFLTVKVSETTVQGHNAAHRIASTITSINQDKTDIVIIARGGGATDDLLAFNEYNVANAIYQARPPVITGIGHDTDTTIADLVADHSVATPTKAATHATPHREDLIMHTEKMRRTAARRLKRLLRETKGELAKWKEQARDDILSKLSALRNKLRRLHEQATKHNPKTHIRRGYYPIYVDGERVRLNEISDGQQITIKTPSTEVQAIACR